jgi:MoaA/NifB/PqqE/SkfB family radical SAM enzyme
MLVMKPLDAVVAVTYRCNARCAMCGIWKSPPRDELPPAAYRGLPASLRDVNLTGGEPFLRDDLPEIHAAIREACPRAQTIVSTNGILSGKILAQLSAMRRREPNIGVAISLDGPAKVHDRIRGVPGAYDRALATLRSLQGENFRNIRLAFTITPHNIEELETVYGLARKLGVEFTCAVQHTSGHYFQSSAKPEQLATAALRRQLASLIHSELSGFSPKRWARAYFMRGLWDFVSSHTRPLPCRAGVDFVFLDPSGAMYTCNAMPFKIGDLDERGAFPWDSPEAADARAKAAACDAGCWMICSARTVMRRNWTQVLAWALRRKLGGGEILRP